MICDYLPYLVANVCYLLFVLYNSVHLTYRSILYDHYEMLSNPVQFFDLGTQLSVYSQNCVLLSNAEQ